MKKAKGLIIDANLLLLLVVGAVDEGRHITKSKRLKAYTLHDFDTLTRFIENKTLFLTPYLATEVSNLIDFSGELREKVFKFTQIFFSHFQEIPVKIKKDTRSPSFIRFGLTDASLVSLASEYEVLTNDNRLLPDLYSESKYTIYPFNLVKELIERNR